METLVIHPKDNSTDFLKPIYQNLQNKTVLSGGVTKKFVRDLIKTHDRVIMLGHGCPYGLFNIRGMFENCGGLIIDRGDVELLNKKEGNIFIWCNADNFVELYDLKGYYSGMFVSEVGESNYCDVPSDLKTVTESNDKFSELLGETINENFQTIYETVKCGYEKFSENNIVAKYNNNRLYINI